MFWPDWVIIRIVKYVLYSYCYHCMDRDLFLTVILIVLKFILMLLKQCNRIVFESYFKIQVKFVSYQTPQQRWLDSSLIPLLFLPQIIIALLWIWRSRTQQFANHQEFAEYYLREVFEILFLLSMPVSCTKCIFSFLNSMKNFVRINWT